MSRTKLSSSLLMASVLATVAGAGALYGPSGVSRSNQRQRPAKPKKHTTEIEQWNAAVEAKKAEKKARKNGGQP